MLTRLEIFNFVIPIVRKELFENVTDYTTTNGIIFKKMLTFVADVQKRHILYENNRLYKWRMIGKLFCVCLWEVVFRRRPHLQGK